MDINWKNEGIFQALSLKSGYQKEPCPPSTYEGVVVSSGELRAGNHHLYLDT